MNSSLNVTNKVKKVKKLNQEKCGFIHASSELQVASWYVRKQNCELQVGICELRVTSCSFKIIKLRAASYELEFDKQNGRVASQKCKLQIKNAS